MTAQEPSYSGRYIIGIDLGTTNCAMCYIDLDSPIHELHQFDIPQLVAPGEVASEPLLPSFTYLPGDHELPPEALKLPWDSSKSYAVGHFAREQGSRIPERLISSAKSWLAHSGVDRTRPILPWGGDLGSQMTSPVDVSFFYLDHLRQAWDSIFKRKKDRDGTPCRLTEQQIIVTVPASFDEAARELTIAAARKAGFKNLTLIEEPLAAFYAWLACHEANWKELVAPSDVIVVIDVGGGTTDFSIVEIDESFTLRRKAVGNHLLLGGDNMDMALARQAESHWKTRLTQRQWTTLCQECRRAKETLLGNTPPESYKVQLRGFGSSVVSGTKSLAFMREQVVDTILEGFFTSIPVDSPPPERRKGIQEMGLPYAADPTITRHLLQFLRNAGPSLSSPVDLARPNKVLFNGGAMIPALIRKRILDVLRDWTEQDNITELETTDFSLAVAQGAATYG
ncbi:MAG: Hsp70 family protein, partial [Victivallales bacterium]|nr:Hsp70 family protein [Victivallales bacterium]